MGILINLFLMAYLLVMTLISIATLFWATMLIFKPQSEAKQELVEHSHDSGVV